MAQLGTPGIVIAGTHSGVGKTSITLGLLAALREARVVAQPFKVGPDYIDPGLHSLVAGRISRNLDGWLLSESAIHELYARSCRGSGIAVVEGVMGMFDGYDGKSDIGSTAHIAKILRLPVLLVVDASAVSRSAAAMVLGFKQFDPDVNIAGVILNRTGGKTHRKWLRDSIKSKTGLTVVGFVPQDDALCIPERHLGLLPAQEQGLRPEFLESLQRHIHQHFDLKRIRRIAVEAQTTAPSKSLLFGETRRIDVRIAIPYDRAFHFYYQDNLDLLEFHGAELIRFKPSEGERLPDSVDGIYMGGGFPEIYAMQLSANHQFLKSLRKPGLKIYAECGGLMCLTREIVDFAQQATPMAALIDARAVMQKKLAAIGYVTVKNTKFNLLGPAGSRFRGHVFHNSILQEGKKLNYTYEVNMNGRKLKDGIGNQCMLASYVHVHFGTNPQLARNFLKQLERGHPARS